MKDVSIIMLARNRPILMRRAIESAMAQKDVDFEFILINKSIDEQTDKVCLEYKEKFPEIKHIKIKPGNIGVGRNAGIDAATGRYLTFIDDDDYFDDDMMGFLFNNAKKEDADISICGCYNDFDGELRPYYIFDGEYVFDKKEGIEELLKREKYNSANPCKLFKNHLFEEVRYPEDTFLDDVRTIYKLFANSEKTHVSGMPKYYFLKHKNNYSGYIESNNYSNELLFEYLDAFNERTKYLLERVPEAAKRIEYSVYSYMLSMVNRYNNGVLVDCDEAISVMKDTLIRDRDKVFTSHFLTPAEREVFHKL